MNSVFFPISAVRTSEPRDYAQDFEAILLSKPQRLSVQSLAIWQDYVGRVIAKGAASVALNRGFITFARTYEVSYKCYNIYRPKL